MKSLLEHFLGAQMLRMNDACMQFIHMIYTTHVKKCFQVALICRCSQGNSYRERSTTILIQSFLRRSGQGDEEFQMEGDEEAQVVVQFFL